VPAFVETIIVVFSLIAFGYAAAWKQLIRQSTGEGLADFVFTIALPLLLFRTVVHSEFDHGLPLLLWATYFTAVFITWAVGHTLLRVFFGRDVRGGVVGGVTASFSNLLLIGAPFFSGIYGDKGLAILSQILSVHLPIMMAVSIVAFDYGMRRDGLTEKAARPLDLAKGFVRQLLSNPLIIGIFAGLVVRISGLPVPNVADRVIVALGSAGGPLALFSMGISLYGYGIRGQIPSSLVLVGLKLVFMPAVALAAALAFGLPELTAKVAVVAASLPAGANTWLIATRFGTGQRLASTSMTIGTALAALSSGFWLMIVEQVF
jgi:malonate transporter and related proteins